MVLYWALATPALLLALLSLRGERRRLAWFRAALSSGQGACPPATVIVPVKGAEQGLQQNLAALAKLDYPDYELLITVRVAEDLPEGVAPPKARIVVAGPGDRITGEKIENLLAAVRAARPESEILAFADSDVQVNPGWLRSLTRALEQPGVGATTGYRWHTPSAGGFWPLLCSAWDGVVLGTFGPGGAAFAWGGSMAIRRGEFERLGIPARWQGAVSDDYVLSAVVRTAGLRIAFAPGALSADASSITGPAFLGWTRRQLILTRVHRPELWWLSLVAHIFYCGGMAVSVVALAQGYLPAGAALAVQLGIGVFKGSNRSKLAGLALPDWLAWFRRYGWTQAWWTPLVTWVWLYALVASAGRRRIRWRGRSYELR